MSTLLPFHKTILAEIHDPATNDLVVLARGLGLRRLVCSLMKIYDSPKNLVLLINASPEEETAFGEELGIMGCRRPGLRVVGYETPRQERQALYKGGGLIMVTSRILVVDMLQADLPTELVSGIVVLHAEKVTPLVLEAFVIRLFREKNKDGFVKAFTDQPEHITSGLSPLKNIMKELQIRNVHIYPRFHEAIKKSLERRRADVVELSQEMTESMAEIHHAIIQCMTGTLSELKRSNTTLDLEELTVENAYFKSFNVVVRRQLDPVWHKVGPKTKQLVNDLGTLRNLLYYLLTYDPLQFHAYLETLKEANTVNQAGNAKQHQSPWMLTDAAHIIFDNARRRCYTTSSTSREAPPVIDLVDDDDAWDALNEAEGIKVDTKGKGRAYRPGWLPSTMDPVLEELPKWDLLTEVIQEIEEEIIRQESTKKPVALGSNTILIMASSTRTCNLLTDFLSSHDDTAKKGSKGRRMMLQKLRVYLWWKGKQRKEEGKSPTYMPGSSKRSEYGPSKNGDSGISEALQRKDREKAERNQSRRRIRGGAPTTKSDRPAPSTSANVQPAEEDPFAEFWATQAASDATLTPFDITGVNETLLDFGSQSLESEFNDHYGLIPPEQTIIVRAYSDDSDDRVLAELQPRFIVMYEPNMEFIRRVEVYRSAHPGLGVRVYHMVYGNSCEEHKYLAGIRKEKNSFERLIKERGSMLLPIYEDRRDGSGRNEDTIKTISSRYAGGRRELNTEPSKVIVDMREFRSTLPSLLHAANNLVIPATLTVGDYILTPDICVERKSLADLISSFTSGRLYTQCELMSVHYKYPVLLIEFEEDKAFSLEIVSDMKSYAKPSGKYPAKKAQGGPNPPNSNTPAYSNVSLQSKLVLLTLSFPRLRIIWSSSPFATSEIFGDLKKDRPEPDPTKAIATGADDDPDAGAGVNTAAEELLRCLPGITPKNVKYVMSRVRNVRELCEMSLERVQDILGVEPGKACWEFIHKGDTK
ncbi:hypothetical protein DFP72DRAFT_462496 [Ephemerocybe angulata]|uniref:ERCC4 domain-containing protein n=1 Tax=Ephemerocybe angulata TaxID=980116 RepID=A0A8H6M2G8_9AGAR|nr:hypothetical protein DFP72DRAFT_462496 [Tulosesus angulatus]